MAKPKLPPGSPVLPPAISKADAFAIQAVFRADGGPEEQKRFVRWLLEDLCDTYGLSYRPGEEGRRDTDFAEGRRFVGIQLVRVSKINVSQLKD